MSSSLSDLPSSLPKGSLHLVEPIPKIWPGSANSVDTSDKADNVHICILDSSFNPPTLAHLALASAPFPPCSGSTSQDDTPYTSRLLLFSLTNVEKKPTPSDPSLIQRFRLIQLLAQEIQARQPDTPVAIGLINEPTFAGKSRIIHSYFKDRQGDSSSSTSSPIKLSCIVGTDTLVRFFDPRFYQATEGGMDGAFSTFFNDEGSTLVSARRGDEGDRRTEESLLKREEVDKWIQSGSVRLMGEGNEEWVSMSSTKIRKAVTAGHWAQVDKLTIPSIREYIQQEGLYSNA